MTKERLRRYLKIRAEKKQIENMLLNLEVRLYSPKSQQLTGMPAASSKQGGSEQERLADKVIDLRRKYLEVQAALIEEQLAIEVAIESLEPIQRILLRYRYIDGMTWARIGRKMGYGDAQVFRIHTEALQALESAEE